MGKVITALLEIGISLAEKSGNRRVLQMSEARIFQIKQWCVLEGFKSVMGLPSNGHCTANYFILSIVSGMFSGEFTLHSPLTAHWS